MRGTFIRYGALPALSGSLWRSAFAVPCGRPQAPLRGPDVNGIALPEGFTSRVVGRSGERVGGVAWHAAPDGGACFADGDGWIYVSNSGVPLLGGVTALRFGPDGAIRSGYRILSGTDVNRAGGATPWNTWLSCEQTPAGRVFECDPYGRRAPMPRLAMGLFAHQGLACDPDRRVVYLTEREPDGCFYRFRPDTWGDLTTGVLEVMAGTPEGEAVTWERVPTPAALFEPTREQVKGALRFDGGDGTHYSDGLCYFITRGDGRVWVYDAARERLSVRYGRGRDGLSGEPRAFHGHEEAVGDLFVAEDAGPMEINVISGGVAEPFLRVEGQESSAIAGPAFSPDGTRLYFSARRLPPPRRAGASGLPASRPSAFAQSGGSHPSRRLPFQRGSAAQAEVGITYEITGPFPDRMTRSARS